MRFWSNHYCNYSSGLAILSTYFKLSNFEVKTTTCTCFAHFEVLAKMVNLIPMGRSVPGTVAIVKSFEHAYRETRFTTPQQHRPKILTPLIPSLSQHGWALTLRLAWLVHAAMHGSVSIILAQLGVGGRDIGEGRKEEKYKTWRCFMGIPVSVSSSRVKSGSKRKMTQGSLHSWETAKGNNVCTPKKFSQYDLELWRSRCM